MASSRSAICNCLLITAFLTTSTVFATDPPFTEHFRSDAADWYNLFGDAPLAWSASGGPDNSGMVFEPFNFVDSEEGDITAFFRAQDEYGSSDGAFEGNWIEDRVTEFTAFVKHDGPEPLTFFTRFSSPRNFPGAVAVIFQPVVPNVWTKVSIAIDPKNRQFVSYEGSDFQTVFSNIGHIQIGITVPESMARRDVDVTFSLDQPAIAGGDCTGNESLKARCKTARCGGRLIAKLKKGMPAAQVTFTFDGERPKEVTVRDNGKAKVKWCPVDNGEHRVEVVKCDLQKAATCR